MFTLAPALDFSASRDSKKSLCNFSRGDILPDEKNEFLLPPPTIIGVPMKKFLAVMSLVALFVAFSAPTQACDTEGKCKGKANAACCASKASTRKSCCASKASCAKTETSTEAAVVSTPAKTETTTKTAAAPKASATPKANPNK